MIDRPRRWVEGAQQRAANRVGEVGLEAQSLAVQGVSACHDDACPGCVGHRLRRGCVGPRFGPHADLDRIAERHYDEFCALDEHLDTINHRLEDLEDD